MATKDLPEAIYDEADKAFNTAIAAHRLSLNPSDTNYVGNYMYMGVHPDSKLDLFKNSTTRAYDV